MKKLIRLAFGIVSSLFLAVGLARAADKLDPINQALRTQEQNVAAPAPDTTQYCNIVGHGAPAPDTTQYCNVIDDSI
jgi:hypothetical protein